MDIRVFFTLSLVVALVMAFYEIKSNSVTKTDNKSIPSVVFENSQAYQLDTSAVTEVIASKKAEIYKNSEKFEKFSMVTLNKKNSEQYNFINADYASHKKNIYDLSKNVEMQSWNGALFSGNDVQYNISKELITSKSAFTIKKENDTFQGMKLIYNLDGNHFRSKNTHISILLKD